MTTGKDSQLGFAPESTWNTRVAPTAYVRARSFNVKAERALMEDEAIIAGVDTFLDAMIGAEQGGAGTDGDPYLWNYGSAELGSMSIQQGLGGTDGTVHPVDFTGCKVDSWSVGVQAGNKATLDLSVIGGGASEGETLGTASYSRPKVYTYAHSTVTIGGASRKVKSATISGNNNLTGDSRRFLGSRYIDEPLHSSDVELMAELTVEFEDLTDYDSYRATSFDIVTIVLAMVNGDDDLTFTMKGHVVSPPLPDINTKGPLEYPISVKAYGTATDLDAFKVERVNA